MKKFIIGVIIFAGSSMFTFNSCNRNQKAADVPATTLSAINRDPSLSIFSTIAGFSGDENFVNNSSIIIIPVDSAFIRAGITKKIAAKLSPPECDSIVMYYTMYDNMDFNPNPGKAVAFSSGLGPDLFADSTNATLYFNGIAAISSIPVRVGNSSIYKLTQFINMPAESISQIAETDTSLSFFNEALKRTHFEDRLSTGSFTLFMPTNNAFKNAGYPSIASMDAENINRLTQILLYQTIANNHFENELNGQPTLRALDGRPVHVNSKKSLKLFGNANPSAPAYLLNNGMLADNVLTYKTSNVLLP